MSSSRESRVPSFLRLACVGALLAWPWPAAGAVKAQVAAPPQAGGKPASGAAAAQQVIAQAIASLGAGRATDAIAPLEALTVSQPQNGQAWHLLGAALHMDGQIDRALEVHAKAATFPAVRANALYNLGCAYALKGQTDAAFEALKAALADPGGPPLRSQLVGDTDLVSLRSDARWLELLPPAPPDKPFKEEVTVLHLWHGESAGEQFGWEAVDVGDVDGDGAHDVLASAPFHRAGAAGSAAGGSASASASAGGGSAQNGRVALYSGRSGALLWGRVGAPGEQLGIGISGVGDVNGDGLPDVIVGASSPSSVAPPTADAPAGRAYVLSGKDGALLLALEGEAAGDTFGDQVRGLGDVDGDGHADVAVSAPLHDREDGGLVDAGRVTVFSGKTGALLFALDGERAGDHFGSGLGGGTWSVASGGRAGLLLVGAMDAGDAQRGRVSVYRLDGAAAEAFFDIEAESSGNSLGQFFTSLIGDLDGDGVPDVYASDFADTTLSGSTRGAGGRVYLHSGKDGALIAQLAGRTAGEGFGIGNAQAGDVNGDGCPDLVIGAWTNSEVAPRAGKAYVISGKDRATLATFTCALPGDEFGYDATGLGDVDGDGAIDFLVTAASSNDGGPRAGRVYVISGAGVAGATLR